MIQRELEVEVELVAGDLGQFDVAVDGTVIATREKGWKRLLGGGWPSADEVVGQLEQMGASRR